MITIISERHAAQALRRIREQQHVTRQALADRIPVSFSSVRQREFSRRGLHTDALIDTAHALGHDVVLIPSRRPGARPTGTGWPA